MEDRHALQKRTRGDHTAESGFLDGEANQVLGETVESCEGMFERADEWFRVECLLATGAARSSSRRYGDLGEVFDEVFY